MGTGEDEHKQEEHDNQSSQDQSAQVLADKNESKEVLHLSNLSSATSVQHLSPAPTQILAMGTGEDEHKQEELMNDDDQSSQDQSAQVLADKNESEEVLHLSNLSSATSVQHLSPAPTQILAIGTGEDKHKHEELMNDDDQSRQYQSAQVLADKNESKEVLHLSNLSSATSVRHFFSGQQKQSNGKQLLQVAKPEVPKAIEASHQKPQELVNSSGFPEISSTCMQHQCKENQSIEDMENRNEDKPPSQRTPFSGNQEGQDSIQVDTETERDGMRAQNDQDVHPLSPLSSYGQDSENHSHMLLQDSQNETFTSLHSGGNPLNDLEIPLIPPTFEDPAIPQTNPPLAYVSEMSITVALVFETIFQRIFPVTRGPLWLRYTIDGTILLGVLLHWIARYVNQYGRHWIALRIHNASVIFNVFGLFFALAVYLITEDWL